MRFGYLMAVLVLLLSLVLVFIAWSHMHRRELGLAEQQFRSRAEQQVAQVRQHLSSIEVALRGGASLFAVVEHPTRVQWQDYARAMQVSERFPSMVGLGYAVHLDPVGLVRLQEALRSEGRGLLALRPTGVRERYGPILFLEPATQANLDALGFDMFSQPVRRAARAEAMDTGLTRLSGPVELVQDTGHPQPALLLYTPVYASGMPLGDVQQRRGAMQGWVYAPFRILDVLDHAIGEGRKDMLRVVDTTGPQPIVIHQDAGIESEHAFAASFDQAINGRKWRFDYFSGPQNTAAPQLAGVNRLLFLGLAVSLLLFGLTWTLASTEARARQLAASMTESSRRNEQRYRNAMQYSAIGKALLNSDGGILEWNPAFASIVGREPEALQRMRLNDLLGEDSEPVRTRR